MRPRQGRSGRSALCRRPEGRSRGRAETPRRLHPARKREEIEIDDPLQLFARWWEDEPVPVVLATATRDGAPSARAVVLEEVDGRGVAFWTSAESPTGRQLATNP